MNDSLTQKLAILYLRNNWLGTGMTRHSFSHTLSAFCILSSNLYLRTARYRLLGLPPYHSLL